MRRILRDKLIELVRGDEGVAFVVTLGVFFFMYLVIAGVYAVGTSVRERIHLQNACDAAAYSAAVVQADTLSRIATLNRAMSWTYVQMTRRQMDYIVYKWLKHTKFHYDYDRSAASEWSKKGSHCPLHSWWKVWAEGEPEPIVSGATGRVTINRNKTVPLTKPVNDANAFIGNRLQVCGASFYATSDFELQIQADKDTIKAINRAERNLAGSLPANVKTTVQSVLNANCGIDQCLSPLIEQGVPLLDEYQQGDAGARGYFTHLHNNDEDESRFVSICGSSLTGEIGLNRWYVRGDGGRPTENAWDIQRSYKHWQRDILLSQWRWKAAYSLCRHETIWHHVPAVEHIGSCGHSHKNDTCGTGPLHSANCYGDNESRGEPFCWQDRSHVGEQAQPLILRPNYFGSAGTITVGIACTNVNPWLSVFRTISGGLYSAFDPYCQKTVVFASAKAGYRTYDEAKKGPGRNYKIDWSQEGAWNLYTSDWDAVLMPVRMAKTMAESGNWGNADHGFLAQWVSDLGVSDKEMYSGGGHPPDMMIVNELDDDSDASQTRKKWRWYNASRNRDYNSELVQARWQIEKHGVSPNWNRLTDRMFH